MKTLVNFLSGIGANQLLCNQVYTVYLPTFSESIVWDFRLVMTGISENVTATFEDFPKMYDVSKNFWRCSDKMVSSPSSPNANGKTKF